MNICYMFSTKILKLILVCHTDILCNSWPLGEVLPDKEMSFVTRDHTYHHILYKNNCNHKPTYNKLLVQPVITWEYIIYFIFYISKFCNDTCNKQPLGEVLHSVEICFVTSLLKRFFADYFSRDDFNSYGTSNLYTKVMQSLPILIHSDFTKITPKDHLHTSKRVTDPNRSLWYPTLIQLSVGFTIVCHILHPMTQVTFASRKPTSNKISWSTASKACEKSRKIPIAYSPLSIACMTSSIQINNAR